MALAIHEAQIAEHGGAAGIRDRGLLEAALARPRQAESFADSTPEASTSAAMYAIAIVRNHPFVDGNKRVGFVLLEVFLNENECTFHAPDVECVENVWALAAGELSDEEFTEWVRGHARLVSG